MRTTHFLGGLKTMITTKLIKKRTMMIKERGWAAEEMEITIFMTSSTRHFLVLCTVVTMGGTCSFRMTLSLAWEDYPTLHICHLAIYQHILLVVTSAGYVEVREKVPIFLGQYPGYGETIPSLEFGETMMRMMKATAMMTILFVEFGEMVTMMITTTIRDAVGCSYLLKVKAVELLPVVSWLNGMKRRMKDLREE
jgi:hypothetical protein